VHTWTHKTHHSPNFGEATICPLIVFSMISHRGYIQMSFFPKTPKLGILKFLKLRFLPLWRPIISYANLQLRWSFKKSCSPCPEHSKDMWHATYTHVIQGDSWFLVIRSQIDTSTPDPSFGHNLCFKYLNESWEPILDIYILRSFQYYKKCFNPMNFGPSNRSLKIWESIETPTPKVGVHLGMCGSIPSHSLALPGMWMWLLGYTLSPHLSMFLPWLRAQG